MINVRQLTQMSGKFVVQEALNVNCSSSRQESNDENSYAVNFSPIHARRISNITYNIPYVTYKYNLY